MFMHPIRRSSAVLLVALASLSFASLRAAELWVSPSGDDNNSGTKESPFASVAAAQRQARELRRLADPSIEDGVHVFVCDGVYRLNRPLFFRPEDSGTAKSPTVFEAASGEHPVLSGGVTLTGWQKVSD